MARIYQAYIEYIETGDSWFGKIPRHWLMKRIKETAQVINGYPFDSNKFDPESGMPLVRIRDIRSNRTEVRFNGFVPKEALIENGDVLIGMDGDFNVSRWCGGTAALNQRVACIRADDPILQRFLFYVLPFNMKVVNDLTYFTTVKHLSSIDILKTTYVFPPNEELQSLVDFLDHETAKIDTLIDKQQQLIKLLKEKRQAVISHAVTKGLNPDVPMKDSGVEWLGEVPEGWVVSKLGYCAKISNGATPARDNLAYWEDGSIGWLNSSKVNDIYITSADQFITPLALVQTSVQKVGIDDLVIAITGEGQTRGRVAICKVSATINQHLAAISIRDKRLHYEYLFYWLTSQYERIRYESTGAGSTKGAITCSDIVSYPLPLPALEEQKELVAFIKQSEVKLTNLIELSENQTALLQERRTALISAAVTGKIDVRNWQPAG